MAKDVLRYIPGSMLSKLRLKSLHKDLCKRSLKGEIHLDTSLVAFIDFKNFALSNGYTEDTIIKTKDGSTNYIKDNIIFVDE